MACALLGALAGTSPLRAQTPETQAEINEAATSPAIERGREALNQSWFTPPWYDSDRDSVKRIVVKPDWDFWEGWDWSGWDLSQWGLPDMSLLEWLAWIVVSLLLAAIAYVLVRAWLQRDGRIKGIASASSAVEDEADEARVEALPFQVARRAAVWMKCFRHGNPDDTIRLLAQARRKVTPTRHAMPCLLEHPCQRGRSTDTLVTTGHLPDPVATWSSGRSCGLLIDELIEFAKPGPASLETCGVERMVTEKYVFEGDHRFLD